MFLSIIIPVYNVAPYITEAIESIVCQDFSDYEILLINDGSTDGSERIVDDLAVRYDKIRVFHQTNQGVSAARNLGINNAVGDYLWFVDGDDKIAAGAISKLWMNIYPSPDVLSFNVQYFNLSLNQPMASKKKVFEGVINGDEFLTGRYGYGVWSFIYRRDLLLENAIYFIENISHYEDNLFNIEVFNQTRMMRQVDDSLYLYRQNRESSAMQNSNYISYFNSLILILSRLKIMEPVMLQKSKLHILRAAFWKSAVNYFNQCRELKKADIEKFGKDLVESCDYVVVNDTFSSYAKLDAHVYNFFKEKSLTIFKSKYYIFLRKAFGRSSDLISRKRRYVTRP